MRGMLVTVSVVTSSLIVAVGCSGDGKVRNVGTATPRPNPPPVTVAQQPAGDFVLGDPALQPLPGANVETGRLGGSIYQIEVPDQWNGDLVLYMHGCCPEGALQVEPIPARELLIPSGFAWAASSFSSNTYIPGTAADETAALWDYFVTKHGRPTHTFVTGVSMGGAGAVIAAERYADRFDGALPLCPSDGNIPHVGDWFGDFFVAGAYAAGITQQQFDSTEIGELIYGTVLPTINADPAKRSLFESLYTALSGGTRPLVHEGLVIQEARLWDEARGAIGGGMFDNIDVSYEIDGVAGASSAQFNSAAIRIKGGVLRTSAPAHEELTGNLQVPVLILHATGDAQNPLREEKLIRKLVDGTGKGNLLVQHAIQDPEHCGLNGQDIFSGLTSLIDWTAGGAQPGGEDVLASDLSTVGVAHATP